MSKEFLFDSSALLTLIKKELRGEILLKREGEAPPIIDRAAIHTVHVAEIVKKLVDAGAEEDAALEWVEMLDLEVLTDFHLPEALGTGRLCPKQLKLSLGDRIGLAVARARGMTAVTTEEQWMTVAAAHPELDLKVMHLR